MVLEIASASGAYVASTDVAGSFAASVASSGAAGSSYASSASGGAAGASDSKVVSVTTGFSVGGHSWCISGLWTCRIIWLSSCFCSLW